MGGASALLARLNVPALTLGLALLALLPLLLVPHPPLFDYPNHLSRAHVLAHLRPDGPFASWFLTDSFFLANVATDVILVALSERFGAEVAGRILLGLIAILTFGGAVALGRVAAGRLEPWPAFAAVFLFGEMLHWGFLNYLFGVALMLWGTAAWIAFAARRPVQIAIGAAFALATLFCHLVAFGLFVVAIAACEIGSDSAVRLRSPRTLASRSLVPRAIAVALALLPALTAYVLMRGENPLPLSPHFNFHPFEKIAPFTRVLSSGNTWGDAAVTLAVAGLLGRLIWTGAIALDRRLATAAAAFVACLLVLPYTIMQSFFVDNRIAIAAVFMGLAALRSTDRRWAGRRGWTALAVLLALRTAFLLATWDRAEAALAPVLDSFERLERGSVLVAATRIPFEYGTGWFYTRSKNPPDEHVATWATIRADAIVPSIFAKAGQNPLVFDPPSPTLRAIALGPIARVGDVVARRRFKANAVRIRAELDRIGYNRQKVYAVVYGETCGLWLTSHPFRPVSCGSGHALVEVMRLCKSGTHPERADECVLARGWTVNPARPATSESR